MCVCVEVDRQISVGSDGCSSSSIGSFQMSPAAAAAALFSEARVTAGGIQRVQLLKLELRLVSSSSSHLPLNQRRPLAGDNGSTSASQRVFVFSAAAQVCEVSFGLGRRRRRRLNKLTFQPEVVLIAAAAARLSVRRKLCGCGANLLQSKVG